MSTQSRFAAFANAKVGDKDIQFIVDLATFQPFVGSGHLDRGNYQFEIDDMKITEKSGGGLNVTMVSHSVGPEGYGGVPNVRTQPAPDASQPGGGTGGNMLEQIAWAICAHGYKGKDGNDIGLDAFQKPGPDGQTARKVGFAWFKGKKFFASAVDDSYVNKKGDSVTSTKIDRYLTPEVYNAAPGPMKGAEGGNSKSGGKARVSPTQTETPDIGEPNGKTAGASVDAMLGIE